MIPALSACKFSSDKIEGHCCSGLIRSTQEALAIFHACPAVLPATIQIFTRLSVLPDLNEMLYDQPEPEAWLACAVKALIEAGVAAADHAVQLERYAATALGHAGRILKHRQGQAKGYQEHATETTAERAMNLQKAEVAKASKGEATRQAIIQCHQKLLQEKGIVHGLDAAVAKEVGVTPQRVSQVMSGKR